ncbi:MAG: cytosine deaminase [Alphaproteobacteria bacterium]|nr:cytosine deaminase [Alphaproteobacteria bacterium]
MPRRGLTTAPTARTIRNARIPRTLLDEPPAEFEADGEDLVVADIAIAEGRIAAIDAAGGERVAGDIDLDGGQVWPCLADIHTHLDLGHIWQRAPNPDGSLETAFGIVAADRLAHWRAEDLRPRMEFGLRCAYAHGTRALRTHLLSPPEQADTSWGVFRELRDDWRGRIELQGVSLVPVEAFADGDGEGLADLVAGCGGLLGAVCFARPDIDGLFDRVFRLAGDRGIDVDLHIDEALDPGQKTLRSAAEAAIRTRFGGRVQCGHCCSLSVQSDDDVERTLDGVAEAGFAIVSLPMCNLYLMDRRVDATPRRRGVTLVREMAARGIPVSFASDNCRDPFYGYGDHDAFEVFTQAVRVAHLDTPVAAWPRSVTATPVDVMGLDSPGLIKIGEPADLVLFRGRGYSELLTRPQADRVVLRDGEAIDTTLPDHRELDALRAAPAR